MHRQRTEFDPTRTRSGAVVVFAALMLTLFLAMLALVVDVGYISLTQAEMQNAVDAAALAGAGDLTVGLGPNSVSLSETETAARNSAVKFANSNRNGDSRSTAVDPVRDVRFGHRFWDPSAGGWAVNWSGVPYNTIEVTAKRQASDENTLSLFFAGIFGTNSADLTVKASSSLTASSGFRYDPLTQENVMIIPFTVDVDAWNDVMRGFGPDYLYWNGSVQNGGDGACEINIFPQTDESIPSGNFGTLNIGSNSNGTNDLERQILSGLNEEDMTYYDGEIRTDLEPLYLTGEPGISQGFEDELISIIGQTRAMPVFSEVAGRGARVQYQIEKFVGVRIMAVSLSGALKNKYVIVQPASFEQSNAIASKYQVFDDTIFTTPSLVE